MIPRPSLRTILILALAVMLVLALLGVRAGCTAAREARQDANQAKATGKALDGVAAQTPIIREEQKAKENEVSRIEGADTPLPDGFGAELERIRVRDRPADNNSR